MGQTTFSSTGEWTPDFRDPSTVSTKTWKPKLDFHGNILRHQGFKEIQDDFVEFGGSKCQTFITYNVDWDGEHSNVYIYTLEVQPTIKIIVPSLGWLLFPNLKQ